MILHLFLHHQTCTFALLQHQHHVCHHCYYIQCPHTITCHHSYASTSCVSSLPVYTVSTYSHVSSQLCINVTCVITSSTYSVHIQSCVITATHQRHVCHHCQYIQCPHTVTCHYSYTSTSCVSSLPVHTVSTYSRVSSQLCINITCVITASTYSVHILSRVITATHQRHVCHHCQYIQCPHTVMCHHSYASTSRVSSLPVHTVSTYSHVSSQLCINITCVITSSTYTVHIQSRVITATHQRHVCHHFQYIQCPHTVMCHHSYASTSCVSSLPVHTVSTYSHVSCHHSYASTSCVSSLPVHTVSTYSHVSSQLRINVMCDITASTYNHNDNKAVK